MPPLYKSRITVLNCKNMSSCSIGGGLIIGLGFFGSPSGRFCGPVWFLVCTPDIIAVFMYNPACILYSTLMFSLLVIIVRVCFIIARNLDDMRAFVVCKSFDLLFAVSRACAQRRVLRPVPPVPPVPLPLLTQVA